MENKIYIVYDDADDEFLYAFHTLSDAEEFIFSISEDLDYKAFLKKGKEEYFRDLKNKYKFYTQNKISLLAYTLLSWSQSLYITEIDVPETIDSDFYIAYDLFEPETFIYGFATEAEAEEFLLSIAEENEYNEFCSKDKDKYFEERKVKYWRSMRDWLSLDGYSLNLNAYDYYVDKVKMV